LRADEKLTSCLGHDEQDGLDKQRGLEMFAQPELRIEIEEGGEYDPRSLALILVMLASRRTPGTSREKPAESFLRMMSTN
jgi:hypothetical protein